MRLFTCLTAIAACLLPDPALAHAPSGAATLLSGLAHPLTGMDHLAAMIAVGMASAVAGGRASWAWPAAFLAFMAAGFALAIAGLPVPHVEAAIIVSVIALGPLAACAARVPAPLAIAAIGIFALCHGYAHGAEAPAAGYALFAIGAVISSAALQLAGLIAGGLLPRRFGPLGAAAGSRS